MIEPPEFSSKNLSPLSPLPLHPPEPSKIPVLQNQIDPIFNMTSTHTEPAQVTTPTHFSSSLIDAVSAGIDDGSPSAESNFSDAYKEQTDVTEGTKNETVEQVGEDEDSDDYAMTFDSDGEEGPDSQVISQANVEQDTNNLPAPVPARQISPLTYEAAVADAKPAQPNYPLTHPPTADTPAEQTTESPPTQNEIETTKPHTHTYEEIANGEVDIQALLDNITANAEKNEAASSVSTPTSANPSSSLHKSISSLPAHASLPPRPQVPVPSYPYPDDSSKHHPGSSNYPKPSNTYRPPPGVNVPLTVLGAPGTSTDTRGGVYAHPVTSFRQPSLLPTASPISPGAAPYQSIPRLGSHDRPAQSIEFSDELTDADVRWPPDVQRKYDTFLTEERNYVTEGQWDKFPNGSRLFIGNLPSEKVTKRDIFHLFHRYGRLAQIAIKSAYGFVQFHDSAACRAALVNEEGSEVRGRKIHLEISKAQKNTRNAQSSNTGQARRSGSPDYARGNMRGRGGRGQDAHRVVRDEYGRILSGSRDDYRPGRSPSPPRGNFRSHDGYGQTHGGGDSYDGRERWRTRSRSPYGRDNGRYRERSPSPRRLEAIADAELQIPRRESHHVPDVQIILMTQLDRQFVSWVEGELHSRGLKTEVLFLSPRLPLDAIIRRQILEGVHAVSQLDLRSQSTSTIPLQVFNRQAGANNVQFDQYQDLEPRIAAELVLRARSLAATVYQPPQPQYPSGQSYQPPVQTYQPPAQAYQPPAPVAAPVTDLAQMVGQMDNASLQKLLGSMTAPQRQDGPAVGANSTVDLAGLLNGLKPQQPAYQPPASVSYSNPNPISYGAPPPAQQSAQQVQNIMAQLAKFRQ